MFIHVSYAENLNLLLIAKAKRYRSVIKPLYIISKKNGKYV